MSDCDCTADCEGRDDCPSKTWMAGDKGTVHIERLDDRTVTIKVRSPGAYGYSFVNMTWDEWTELRSLDPAPNEPAIAF